MFTLFLTNHTVFFELNSQLRVFQKAENVLVEARLVQFQLFEFTRAKLIANWTRNCLITYTYILFYVDVCVTLDFQKSPSRSLFMTRRTKLIRAVNRKVFSATKRDSRGWMIARLRIKYQVSIPRGISGSCVEDNGTTEQRNNGSWTF